MQLTGGSAGFEQDHYALTYGTGTGAQNGSVPGGNNTSGGGAGPSGVGINGMNGNAYGGANGQGRRDMRDITPEASMHTAWIDFVTQMSAGMSG